MAPLRAHATSARGLVPSASAASLVAAAAARSLLVAQKARASADLRRHDGSACIMPTATERAGGQAWPGRSSNG
eukprot:7170259-Prymnesium_polylepis.1